MPFIPGAFLGERNLIRGTVLACAFAAIGPAPALPQSVCPDPASITGDARGVLAHVRYLADDALEGRASGSEGERCAAEYLVRHFERLGLTAAGDDGSWTQPFPVRTGSAVRGGSLAVAGGDFGDPLEPGAAWRPFGFSESAHVEAPLVYDGAGVAHGAAAAHGGGSADADAGRPERASARGHIVVVEGASMGLRGLYADPHFRASVAAGRGAEGVIVLLEDGADLPEIASETRPTVGVPVVAVSGEVAQAVREAAREGATATVDVSVEAVLADAHNVVALLPGADPALRDEVIVIGAHYDHLGWGGEGSLDPDATAIHNGADDNASGTAALVEVADRLTDGPRPARSILFIAFSGEEMGLLGSAHYVAHPTHPIDDAVAMINMDMVGRLRENTLTVYGVATADEWEGVVERANERLPRPLELSKLPDGFGPSDHSSFYGEGIPVLHLFTNTHTEYHRPDDDWQTVDGEGIERVAHFATEVTRLLAGSAGRVAVALTPRSGAGNPHGGAVPTSDDPGASSGGYGPYLGSIPDMAPLDHGVRLTGVREGSPAERAGIRGGDVIVEFGGREITDLYAFTYALRAHEPGDEVEIVVERNGERVTVTAVLGRRR